eukprot:15451736-Alexandrium_andersonii.AAC.1
MPHCSSPPPSPPVRPLWMRAYAGLRSALHLLQTHEETACEVFRHSRLSRAASLKTETRIFFLLGNGAQQEDIALGAIVMHVVYSLQNECRVQKQPFPEN